MPNAQPNIAEYRNGNLLPTPSASNPPKRSWQIIALGAHCH